MLGRRQLLAGLAAGGVLGAAGIALRPGRGPQRGLVSCVRKANGDYAVVAFTPESAELMWECRLPARGHAIAVSPDGSILAVFARRPGAYVWIIDAHGGNLLQTLPAPSSTQFNGHGLIVGDGQQVWVAATSYAANGQPRGEILHFDSASAVLEQRWPSAGLDPHECAIFDKYLVVANGGYAEDYGDAARKQLVPAQPPNLAWLDLQSGELQRRDTLTDPKLSIRHLAVGPQGVFAGFQHADGPMARAPLLGRADAASPLAPMSAPVEGWESWYGYILSLYLAVDDGVLIATSPRSGRMGVWDAVSGKAIRSLRAADVSGVTGCGDQWWASTGHGQLLSSAGDVREMDHWQFDNHMVALPPI